MKKICFILFLLGYNVSGQEVVPYFENFTKLEYNGENSNWDLAQHPDGTMYIANGRNLLTYNGDFWQKYQLPKPLIIRSVAVINDTVYTGAYHQFGYWVKNEKNKLVYTSISDTLKSTYFENDEIWKIIPYKENIIFQSFEKFFVYNSKTKEVNIIPFGNISAVYGFLIDETVFLTTKNHGIYKLINDKLEFVGWSNPLINYTIQSIAAFKEGILVATRLNGLFYYDGNEVRNWNPSLLNQFENLEINNLKIFDDNICIGTINNGLLVLDFEGNVKFQINKENGLTNNTVLRQLIDNNNNLWLGLDNGLSKIYLSKNFYWFNDRSGSLGTVFTILNDGEELVLGSNHGVFFLNQNGLEFLESSNGQVWDLTKVDDEIICGHNNGTFVIKNNRGHYINGISGGMDFKQIPGTAFYLQPNYTGIARYQKRNEKWVFEQYDAVDFPVKKIAFDENNELWIEATHRGIYHYEFRNNFKELELVEKYEPSSKNQLLAIGKTIFIVRPNQLFKYDVVNDTLVEDNLLKNKLQPYKKVNSVGNNILVVANEASLKFIDLSSSNQFILNEDVTISRILQDYSNARLLNNNIFIFMDDGFLKIDPSAIFKDFAQPKVSIEMIKVKEEPIPLSSSIEIPFRKNLIHFFFSVSAPGILNAPKYSYKLEGYETNWSRPSFEPEVGYSNLPAGDYVFKVRSTFAQGEENYAKYAFTILPPWYLNNFALFGYVLLLLFVIVLIHHYNKRKFSRRQKIFQDKMEYEQKLAIQKQNFENKRKITQLEQEKLKSKLKGKSKELASYAALMAQKEDILMEMEREINKSQIKKKDEKLYQRLMEIKNKQTNSENEWKLFERNFNEVHEDFFKTLQSKYPNLTPKDLQLCAYLKLNLSSKEIAPLIGITFRSVELHRYRLRKKFHLRKNQNLVKFLIRINS